MHKLIGRNLNKINFCFFIILAISFSCANPKPPTGGPPDTTSPKVIEFSPNNFEKNFRGDRIFLRFNKWMDRNSVINNISINPLVKYEVDWSGKSLEIIFREIIDTSSTYYFLLGTEIRDLDGNKAESPFYLIFTPGSKIDSGKIIGKILEQDSKNIFVYAIPWDKFSDSINKIENLFHYKTQPNSKGEFQFEALKNQQYLVIAYKDNNNNKTFEPAFDNFGISPRLFNAEFSPVDTCYIALQTPIDKKNPSLIDINSQSANQVDLIFDEPIKIDTSKLNQIKIISSKGKTTSPDFGKVAELRKEVCKLFFKTPLDTGELSLEIAEPTIFNDSAGNPLIYKEKIKFRNNRVLDTSVVQILKPEKSFQISTLSQNLILEFIKPVNKFSANKIFVRAINKTMKDTNYPQTKILDAFSLVIEPKNFRYGNSYQIELVLDTIYDFLGNKFTNLKESLSIDILPEPLSGSLRGSFRLFNDTIPKKFVAVLKNAFHQYFCKVTNGVWHFDQVPVGDYLLYIFVDRNINGKYDFGQLNPLKFSEEIVKVIPNVKVQKGWTIEEINLWK